jgi:WD40 repeat protein
MKKMSHQMLLSPDEKSVAVFNTGSNQLFVQDVTTNTKRFSFTNKYQILSMCIDAQSLWLFININGASIHKVSIQTGTVVSRWDPRRTTISPIGCMATCCNTTTTTTQPWLAAAGYQKINVLDYTTMTLVFNVYTSDAWIRDMIFVRSGILYASNDNTAIYANQQDSVHFTCRGHTNAITMMSTDTARGDRILTATHGPKDFDLRIWDGHTGLLLNTIPRDAPTRFARFICDGEFIMTAHYNTCCLWRTESLKLLPADMRLPTELANENGLLPKVLNMACGKGIMVMRIRDDALFMKREDQLPWFPYTQFRFNGSNFRDMSAAFRQQAVCFLLCCARQRREEAGPLAVLPRDMRQLILVALSRLLFLS